METEPTSSATSQDRVLNEVLDALIYEDRTPKMLTHSILKLVAKAKPKMGEANALFIEGILRFHEEDSVFYYFLEAEQKRCRHPMLYRYLAEGFRDGNRGVGQNISRILEYSTLAISGTYSIAFPS